jgi:asparagine synthase (glutamine-hydrolysing)
MCGITGIVDTKSPVGGDVLARMANALRHRGPDDESYFIADPKPGRANVGFGFRRLSIIDLSGGRQPMCNEDGSLWLVCNGEIYNFPEIKKHLVAEGHQFRTGSDVEVLLHLYEDHGEDCVQHVNGMFAFAIWDANNQKLFLGRDRLGKKPLYYRATADHIIFGSEVKALLQHPQCPRELDFNSLSKYLTYEYVPAPHSIFRGIHKLPAGHTLTWSAGKTNIRRYWDVTFGTKSVPTNENELAEQLRERLKEAVRLRLISDVPLGVFLSGGIDSSSVVALMSELRPAKEIKTFAIGFDVPSFDESHHARRIAEFFGTDHHEHIFKSSTLIDTLPAVAEFMDEPLGDASIVPTHLLSKFTREHVTVALGGDGGDELFAGYPTFQADRVARLCPMPSLVKSIGMRVANLLPTSTENFSLDFKIKQFLRGLGHSAEIRNQTWLGSFSPDEQRGLLKNNTAIDNYTDIAAALKNCSATDAIDRLTYFYCKFYLQDDILTKVDRASMACSLEVRAPFLDYTFVEFANSIPTRFKLRGSTTKYILKKAMAAKLPADIVHRGKKGFGIPVAKWFRNEMRDMVSDIFSEARIRQQNIFNEREVTRLWTEHQSGRRDNRKPLWTLFMFQLWFDKYMKTESRA